MRYYELFETDFVTLGLYDPNADRSAPEITDTRKPEITLRHLNLLKHQKKRKLRDKREKLAFYPQIYGDRDIQDDFDLERRELEQIKDEISLEKDAIRLEIDRASVAEKDREHIRSLANRALRRVTK